MNLNSTEVSRPASARILVVEDELPMRTVLRDCLERQGYRVVLAVDGAEGIERALKERPDLIVMDVMMPRMDGFEVCRELRRLELRMPILLLTAKGQVSDKVSGLDAGADDYLVKPFSREELLARVRAQLRRLEREDRRAKGFRVDGFEVDFEAQKAMRDGESVAMTAKEIAMLRLLCEHAGEAISRETFLDLVWGYAAFPTTRTVDKHVVGLRQKIEVNPDEPRYLQTVHGVGYRLDAPAGAVVFEGN